MNDEVYIPFQAIRSADPEFLSNLIRQEHPQVIALVLSLLEPVKASDIIRELDPDTQSDVIRRIACMDRVSLELIRGIEKVLKEKLGSLPAEKIIETGGVESAVKILNQIGRSSEKRIIEKLEEDEPELAEEIKKRQM